NYSAQFVTRFSTDPEFVVVLVEQSDNALVFAPRIPDVDLLANLRSAAKCFAKISGEQSMSVQMIFVITSQDGIQGDYLRRNEIGGGFDHVTSRTFDATYHVLDACERAEPMGGVSKVGTGNTWEKIFCAAGETGDFMRHCGAENQNRVVDSRTQAAIQIHF